MIQADEQREQNRLIQQGLAEKIIKLEETIDFIKEDQEEKLSQAEFSYRQELEQIKSGTMQREKQLLSQIDMLTERNADLEISRGGQDMNMSANNGTQPSMLRKSSTVSANIINQKLKGGDNLRQAASVHSLVQAMDVENQEII